MMLKRRLSAATTAPTPINLLPATFVGQQSLRRSIMVWVSIGIVLVSVFAHRAVFQMAHVQAVTQDRSALATAALPIIKQNESMAMMKAKHADQQKMLEAIGRYTPNDDALQTIAELAITSHQVVEQSLREMTQAGKQSSDQPFEVYSVEVTVPVRSADEGSAQPKLVLVCDIDGLLIEHDLADRIADRLDHCPRLEQVKTEIAAPALRSRTRLSSRSRRQPQRMVLTAKPVISEVTP